MEEGIEDEDGKGKQGQEATDPHGESFSFQWTRVYFAPTMTKEELGPWTQFRSEMHSGFLLITISMHTGFYEIVGFVIFWHSITICLWIVDHVVGCQDFLKFWTMFLAAWRCP